jgi:hypothetical protein
MVDCTICGTSVPGVPDADLTCPECEQANFHGDPLRKPPPQQRPQTTAPWWQRERLPLAPRRHGLRALTFVQGPWTWSEDEGIVERNDASPR